MPLREITMESILSAVRGLFVLAVLSQTAFVAGAVAIFFTLQADWTSARSSLGVSCLALFVLLVLRWREKRHKGS
jgi:hypothetical protein